MRASRSTLLVNQGFRGLSLRSFWNSASVDQNSSFCVDLVRQHDYESYLMGLLIPRPHRRSFFAIRAFNIEIAMVKDQVPNNAQLAGRLRFQYWRDSLQQIEQQAQLPKYNNQPVALELCRAITQYNLPIRWFERAIESRQEDLASNGVTEDYSALETLAEKGHSSLLYLTLQLLGREQDESSQYIASHIGVACGLVTLLRGYSHHASSGTIVFPRSIMTQFEITTRLALQGPSQENESLRLKDATHDMASQAYAHLRTAREIYEKDRPKESFLAFLPAVSCSLYLDALQQEDFDPFLTSLHYAQRPPLRYQLALTKAWATKTF